MVRTQILLDEVQREFLKETSRRTGRSMSALVREAVERMQALQERTARKRAAIDLIGAFEANRDDIAEQHDRYLGGSGV